MIYKITDLYLVAVVKVTKDFMNKTNNLKDCFEKVGFAVCTKSVILPNVFVDVFTKDFYCVFSKNTKVGDYIFVEADSLLAMCDGMKKEEAEIFTTAIYNQSVLAELLRFANADYPQFAQQRLAPNYESEEEIDTSKMN